jgi:isopenicillin-N N-acyltransferase-like protein
LKHGKEAKTEVERGLRFYSKLFEETAKLSWPDVCDVATRFEPPLRQRWPNYVEEMKGVASGAGVPYISILALNVRTEIAYGLSKDGCTALYWRSEPSAFLAQNCVYFLKNPPKAWIIIRVPSHGFCAITC